jgi:hypothetical protein
MPPHFLRDDNPAPPENRRHPPKAFLPWLPERAA